MIKTLLDGLDIGDSIIQRPNYFLTSKNYKL